jgi:hypothetical protein
LHYEFFLLFAFILYFQLQLIDLDKQFLIDGFKIKIILFNENILLLKLSFFKLDQLLLLSNIQFELINLHFLHIIHFFILKSLDLNKLLQFFNDNLHASNLIILIQTLISTLLQLIFFLIDDLVELPLSLLHFIFKLVGQMLMVALALLDYSLEIDYFVF